MKIENPKLPKFYTTQAGDRTTTPAKKRKMKEEVGFKCQVCGKKFDEEYLQIHHKKEISKHKNQFGLNMQVMTMGKKHKPAYDRKSNLQVICIKCHNKTKKTKKAKRKENNPLNMKLDLGW